MAPPQSIPGIPKWDDLLTLPFESIRKIEGDHEQLLQGSPEDAKPIAGLHIHRFLPEMGSSVSDVYSGLGQMASEARVSPSLLEEVRTMTPITFSRLRRYHTGTDLQNKGAFVEQLYRFPTGDVRTFTTISKDPARVHRIAAIQHFVHELHGFAIQNPPSESPNRLYVTCQLRLLRCRNPLSVQSQSITNLYLNATDLKTILKKQSIEERVDSILNVSFYDLALHFYSRDFLKSKEGKQAASVSRTWKSMWKKRSLFDCYDEAEETIEEIILKADCGLSKQLQDAGLLGKDQRLKNGSAKMLYTNPHIASLLELLGIVSNHHSKEPVGFSMGDHNPGNVMTYHDGTIEFIDFEDAKLAPLSSLLFARWVRGGVYGQDGSPLKIRESRTGQVMDAEKAMLDSCFSYIHCFPSTTISKTDFVADFNRHKVRFLLRLSRRYKQYESIDSNPRRMRDLKRFYFSWFVKELQRQKRVSGPGDAKLQYVTSLFEAPLSDFEMERIYHRDIPAFCYRSELSPVNSGLNRAIHDDVETRIATYQRSRFWKKARGVAGAAMAAILIPVLGYFGYQGYHHQQRLEETKSLLQNEQKKHSQATIALEEKLNKIDRELAWEKGKLEFERDVRIVRMYHHFETPHDPNEILGRNNLQAWINQFWHTTYENGIPELPPSYRETREKYQADKWEMGNLFTGYAAFIDWPTVKEGMTSTGCYNWFCDLGRWIEKRNFEENDKERTWLQTLPQEEQDKQFPRPLNKYERLRLAIYSATENYVDSWMRNSSGWDEKAKKETYMFRTPHFGLGHTCTFKEAKK